MIVKVKNVGQYGVIKDLSRHEMPINSWTDANNVRFLGNSTWQCFGHRGVLGTPAITPYHIIPLTIGATRYWLICGSKIYHINEAGTHTNITPQTGGADRTLNGAANTWTSTTLGGLPIINTGGSSDLPLYWDLTVNKCVDLPNWPAATYCKSIRAFKNYLVAMYITKSGGTYPYMVKWSHPADPGAVPSSWDQTDPTKQAGEYDIAEGQGAIIDGLQLRNSFVVYKEGSIWRMDFVGGQYVFQFSKVIGSSGALSRNCIIEVDGYHLVLTGNDVILHDGAQVNSILDNAARRHLFQSIDIDGMEKCFVFKSSFTNEAFICYPSAGASICDKALVWNYKEKTVSFRDLPSIFHAADGPVVGAASRAWNSDTDPWASDLTSWNSQDWTPERSRVLMAPNTTAIYMLDASASQDGPPVAFSLERSGLSFDAPESVKLVRSIRPRIYGDLGGVVNISVGGQSDPWGDPEWCDPVPYTIGSTVSADMLVAGRYIALKFESDTAYQFRLDSYDIDVEPAGAW